MDRKTMTAKELKQAMKGRNLIAVAVHNCDYDVKVTKRAAMEMREDLRGYITVTKLGNFGLVIEAT